MRISVGGGGELTGSTNGELSEGKILLEIFSELLLLSLLYISSLDIARYVCKLLKRSKNGINNYKCTN